jgi:hypothetical protein
MRVTIIPADGFVSVDGLGFNGIDMESVEESIHAVQWNGSSGEVERKDEKGKMIVNEEIDSLDQFYDVIAQYNAMRAAYEEQQAEIEAEQNIVEV